MKEISLGLALFLAWTAQAKPAALRLPEALDCKAVLEVYGNPTRQNLENYQHVKLRNLTSDELKWGSETGVLKTYDDKIVFDFGVGAHGGDQYSSFTFLADDFEALLSGKQSLLSGVYEDGYDWADGYHTRAQYVVHCQVAD